jgi:predicted nuclease of restriction endonuclease-like (RecB) superfamily
MSSDSHRGRSSPVSLDEHRSAGSRTAQGSPVPKLHAELRDLILATRERVAQTVNSGLTLLYWQVGDRIRRHVLKEKRAAYGEEIVQALAAQLAGEFGGGFSRRNLFNMVRFSEVFPDFGIVQALTAQLGWTHFTHLIRLDDPLKRDFYAEMCRIERWSTRALDQKIQSMLFERTALSKKPEQLAREELAALREHDRVSPDLVFRDPYVLGFLGLADTYAERDLESAILREIEAFLVELGRGFTFVARQKRMTIDGIDHYLDLLFFHRDLRRLIAVELKLGEFQAPDKGQMELYLGWLREHEQRDHEEPPLGLILCAGRREETIRLMKPEQTDIHVASYIDQMLPQQPLERKLHEAVRLARERLAIAEPQTAGRAEDLPRRISGLREKAVR